MAQGSGNAQNGNIRKRHQKRQQARIRAMKRRRITFFCLLTVLAVLIIMLFTPLFNISHVVVEGSSRISTEEIQALVGDVSHENLFRFGTKRLKNEILKIPYADGCEIRKSVFPSAITVVIEEAQPFGYLLYGESYVIIDKSMKVLEIVSVMAEAMPELTGITITEAVPGAALKTDNDELCARIAECIQCISDTGMSSDITVISFGDISSITFNYQNRLDVICGSDLDFRKKLGLFREAVNSSRLTENSRGTIDLSITGKAIYTP